MKTSRFQIFYLSFIFLLLSNLSFRGGFFVQVQAVQQKSEESLEKDLLKTQTETSAEFQNETENIKKTKKNSKKSLRILKSDESENSFILTPQEEVSKKTGLSPIASKPYNREDGFEIGIVSEVLGYQAKQEKQVQGLDSEPVIHSSFKENVKSYQSSGNISLYFSHRFSDLKLIDRRFVTIFNSKIRLDDGNFYKKSTYEKKDSVNLELEFAYLDFLFYPYFNLRIGHQPLPIGLVGSYNEPSSFLSVRVPEVERLIIPERWHENGIQIWGGNLYSTRPFFRYSIGGYTSLSALKEDGSSNFNPKNFISEGVQNKQSVNGENIAFATDIDFFLPFNTTVGGSFFVGNTTKKDDSSQTEPRNKRGNHSKTNLKLQSIHPLHAYLWTAQLKSEVSFLILKALFTQGILPNAYKLPKKDQQIRELDRQQQIEQSDESQRVEDLEEIEPASSNSKLSGPGRVAQGYYVSLGIDFFKFFDQTKENGKFVLFGRFSEYNTHYKVNRSVLKDKRLYKNVITAGWMYTPKKEHLRIKLNFQRHENYYTEKKFILEGSVSVSF